MEPDYSDFFDSRAVCIWIKYDLSFADRIPSAALQHLFKLIQITVFPYRAEN